MESATENWQIRLQDDSDGITQSDEILQTGSRNCAGISKRATLGNNVTTLLHNSAYFAVISSFPRSLSIPTTV